MSGLRPRQVWGAGVLVAATGLVALVAVAADQAPFDVAADNGDVQWPGWMAGVIAGILALAVVAGLAVVLASLSKSGKVAARARRRSTLGVIVLAAITIMLLLFLPKGTTKDEKRPIPEACDNCGPRQVTGHDGTAVFVVVLAGAIVAALALAAYGSRKLRAAGGTAIGSGKDDAPDAAATLQAVERSLADLDGPLDDRAAIIAAYATLLDGLAAAGCRRRPAEAPDELVMRALSSLTVRAEPLRALTGLFTEARFSTHPLGPDERRRAIAALEQARSDLRTSIDASATQPVSS